MARPAKIGIFAGFSFAVPFAERMQMVREAGFDATALWWEDRHPDVRRLRHLAPDLVRRAGLDIDHLHAPFQRCAALWSGDRETRMDVVREHLEWIGDCARHGVPRLVMHVATGASTPPPGESGLDSIRRLHDAAAEKEVTLAIENTRLPGHVEFLLDRLPLPHLGLCHDTSHARLYGEEEHSLLERHGERVVATHLSDTDGRRDLHLLPGEGVCDYAPTLDAARRADVTLLLEVRHREREESIPAYLERARAVADALATQAPDARTA